MLKLRFSKPVFKQYKDGKICVCIYNCDIINNKKEILDSFKVSGTAKLADVDIASDLGFKLADSRAKLAAYKIAANILSIDEYEEIMKRIEEAIEICEFSDFMHYMKRKEVQHIDRLIEESYV